MRCSIMSLLVAIITFSFTLTNFSQARNVEKLNSVVVIGTVYCDTCIQEDSSKASYFLSGALVAVECGYENSKITFQEEAKTNENGEFKVCLPFSVPKHTKKINGCSVKLLDSNTPFCNVASSTTHSMLHLKSRKKHVCVFSFGLFTFMPSNQHMLCNKKIGLKSEKRTELSEGDNNKEYVNRVIPQIPSVFPPIPDPLQPPSILPPIPNPLQPPSIFPPIPNPFQPPPSIFPPIPNPFQPPPSIFPPIPNPFQPLPSIFPPIKFPLIPGLVPSPPPPAFPIPFPPNPFQPPPSIFPPFSFPPLFPGLVPSPPPPPPPVFPIPLPPSFPGFPPSSKKDSP